MTNPLPASRTSLNVAEARYVPLVKVASGGMATVFVGTLRGPLGFSQLVAIKRPHEHLLEDESFRQSLIEEARVAAQVRHANVVDVRDVEVVGDSIQLIMDYVEGASLGQLMAVTGRAGKRLSRSVAIRVVLDALAGLSAVHEVTDGDGIPLGLVHRDISPQNILVGVDGVARVTDFGIAMAEYGAYTPTTQGTLKGKIGYMAPEYIRGIRPDARVDVFGMGVVLWEALAGRRLFKGANDADGLDRLLHQDAPLLSEEVPELAGPLDAVLVKALAKPPEKRFQTANSFATALENAARTMGILGSHADVAREVRETVGPKLEKRRQDVRAAQMALESVESSDDLQLEEDEGTTRKYEPAKRAIATPPPVMNEAIAVPVVAPAPATSNASRRLVMGLLLALGLTFLLIIIVLSSTNSTSSVATPVESTAPTSTESNSAANTPTNIAAPPASPPATPPMATEAPIPSATTTTIAATGTNTTKTTTTKTTPTPSNKTKTRKLPPNPYGP